MANVFTKRSHYPLITSQRDYADKNQWPGQLRANHYVAPDRPLPSCEHSHTVPDPKYTLNTTFRVSYQWPNFTDDMPDDILKERFSYSPFRAPSTGVVPALNPPEYKPFGAEPEAATPDHGNHQ